MASSSAAPDSPEDRETMRRDFERGVYEREEAESETPETDKEEAELEMARGIMEERGVNELPVLKKKIVRSTFARSLERRLVQAETMIKGHMRVEDELKADLEEKRESLILAIEEMQQWREQTKQAQVRIAGLEKDAARYRWLRGPALLVSLNFAWGGKIEIPKNTGQSVEDACDAAIDAAILTKRT
jgi:transcriptional regulator NrdR family protein